LQLRVHSISFEAQDIHSYDLRSPSGEGALPAFTAGAHVDIQLGNGLTRSYSLINPQGERHRYVVAVSRDAKSRGGSHFMHEGLRVGDVVEVQGPRNNFPLTEDAPHSVLVAGGIGITPVLAMVRRLSERGASWELHYSARSREAAAFLQPLSELQAHGAGTVHLNFDQESGRLLDIPAIVASAPAQAHFYCCGPEPMLAAFEGATAARPAGQVHVEHFSAGAAPMPAGGFRVVLARSGTEIAVLPGKTILLAMLEAGLDAPHSCMAGVCGTCEARVLSGTPDHRDFVLQDAERAANNVIMICCSGSKTDTLVLDL
jgi:ferredoxin-NADP reductase